MEMIVNPLIGGAILGLGSVLLMLFSGRVAGISGIAGGILFRAVGSDLGWRIAFVVGLILGPVLLKITTGASNGVAPAATTGILVVGGLLVGIGTSIGSGCTSGHGVCGISRLSMRSIVATVTFMLFAGVTVFVFRHLLAGG